MSSEESRSPTVGADIEALCRKCGDVWHVVAAVVDGEVARVQCKQCGAYHRYRPPAGAKKRKRPSAARSRAGRSSRARKPEPPSDGPTIEPDLTREIRPYDLQAAYEPADRIDHPRFGIGVVESVPAAGKMLVYFPGGRKLLAQARPPSAIDKFI